MSVVDHGILIHTVGGDRVRDALERRQHRVDRYYTLVRRQRDAIRTLCAEQGHLNVVQLEMFAVAA